MIWLALYLYLVVVLDVWMRQRHRQATLGSIIIEMVFWPVLMPCVAVYVLLRKPQPEDLMWKAFQDIRRKVEK